MHLKRMILIAVLALTGGAQAQQDEIIATIDGQLQAFIARDAEAAFSYASPTIQGLFGTPDNFAAMVATGYPMVWTPSDPQMLDLRDVAGSLWQRVHITDSQGRGWVLDYQMVQTEEGWKINAVQVLPGVDVGA
jgi:Domain of unknown function (DUF4864)